MTQLKRVTTMLEPLKLISVGLTVLLLAPFGFVFWLLATHPPLSESERRAQLERAMREQASVIGTTNAADSFVTGVMIRESVAFSEGTASWLSFYPRQWVGWLGLTAVAVIAFCIGLSLFFPGSNEMSTSTRNYPPPAAATPAP